MINSNLKVFLNVTVRLQIGIYRPVNFWIRQKWATAGLPGYTTLSLYQFQFSRTGHREGRRERGMAYSRVYDLHYFLFGAFRFAQ